MLDALKQAPGQAEEVPPVLHAVAADAEGDHPSPIPFIEVGPQRSLEASPDVLACMPPQRPAAAAPPPAPAVAFHPLPSTPLPSSRLAAELVAYHAPEQPAGLQYRQLLPGLLKACGFVSGERGRALLFTAAHPASGTTTVLLNVAITAARQGRRRVLVVDAHPHHPTAAERLGLPVVPGLREVLAGSAGLEEAIQTTEQSGLWVLTAGAAPSSGTRFMAATLRSLLRQARQRFDLVLVDGPAWDGQAEVSGLGLACDAVCLVLPEAEVGSPAAEALLQALPQQGVELAGFIVAARPSP
jgi:Mrp family chromosome partitioning ATPase